MHNPAFVTNARLYNGVQSAYMYGCITCIKHLNLDHQFVCPECLAKTAEADHAADPFSQSAAGSFLTDPQGTFDVSSEEVHMGDADKKWVAGEDIAELTSKAKKSDGGDD